MIPKPWMPMWVWDLWGYFHERKMWKAWKTGLSFADWKKFQDIKHEVVQMKGRLDSWTGKRPPLEKFSDKDFAEFFQDELSTAEEFVLIRVRKGMTKEQILNEWRDQNLQ